MSAFVKCESKRVENDAAQRITVGAGDGYMIVLKKGQVLRIVDVEGNQAADSMFFDADNTQDHYSATATISAQKNIYLTTGTVLRAESGKPLLTIVADTCGNHDTLGGSCSAQSNTIRYSRDIQYMHNCRDSFMLQMAKFDGKYEKRDLAPNINFFMNVPVTKDGELEFVDGVSGPGYYVEMRAEANVTYLLSNCPQLNNPCNAYNPTPVELLIFDE
ncbi:MAG: urea amidolyase associated protein UAAP2 [Ethanoligenens sp.]